MNSWPGPASTHIWTSFQVRNTNLPLFTVTGKHSPDQYKQTWIQVPTLTLSSWVTLDKTNFLDHSFFSEKIISLLLKWN